MKMAVWNLKMNVLHLENNKKQEPQKVSRLLSGGGDFEAPDLAVFLEISNEDLEPYGGVWLPQRPNAGFPYSGIRLWHRRKIAVTPLDAPDFSDVNAAAAYYVSPSSVGEMKFTPFVLIPFWALPVNGDGKPEKKRKYLEELEKVLSKCRDAFFSGTGTQNVLITGDTNLTDRERAGLNAYLEDFDRECSAGMTLPDLSAPPEEAGSVPGKRPHDTLFHCGGWFACDLAIASGTFAPQIEGRIGRYAIWYGPRDAAGSDHLPLYFTVS